ncbi:MAG: glycosyltransferase [Gammaproteobacteria bacterium]|nr:glycosyltransferase [Gammaproteobacteria bacterium]
MLPGALVVTARLNPLTLGWLLLDRVLRMLRRAIELRRPGLVAKWMTVDRHSILARALFSFGEFESAMTSARRHLERKPDDWRVRMVALGCAVELGDFESAAQHLGEVRERGVPKEQERQLACYGYAVARAGVPERSGCAIRELDELFSSLGCRAVRVGRVKEGRVFDALSGIEHADPSCSDGEELPTESPLVSVIMTAFNAEDVIATAVKSILDQSYHALELIVVDDSSTDGTLRVLRRLACGDRRVRIIEKPTNDGTYVSKNLGIKESRGKYIALQDSDDWSHPERIGKCVSLLERSTDTVALTTEWMRMTTEGAPLIQSTTKCTYRACISLIFRRHAVLSRVGYFDSVRAEGDAEYIERLGIVFGTQRVVEMPWPLSFGRARVGTITSHSKIGLVRGRARPARAAYRKAYKRWHAQILEGGDGFVAFPLRKRPFAAPRAILADARNAR